MPGVYAWGTFDTWSPGYLMFMAATHNGISRLYETFGNSGSADTEERTLTPAETSRTWYRQNPPISRVRWSLRNNNNYEQTGVLISLNYLANNRVYFLRNFYDKSKRSILKARVEGPSGIRVSRERSRPGVAGRAASRPAEAGGRGFTRDRVVQREDSRSARAYRWTGGGVTGAQVRCRGRGCRGLPRAPRVRRALECVAGPIPGAANGGRALSEAPRRSRRAPPDVTREFPAGSYIVRMDQPYSRIADALLDYQYWAPNDPQTRPYDDTGWTFPEGFAVQAVRVTDASVLSVAGDGGDWRRGCAGRDQRDGPRVRHQSQCGQRVDHAFGNG